MRASHTTDCHLWLGPDGLQWGAWRQGRCVSDACGSAGLTGPDAAPSPDGHRAALGQAVRALATRWTHLAADPASGRLRLWVTVADVHLHVATLAWTPLLMRDDLLPSLAQAQLVQAGHELHARDVLRVGEGGAGQPRLLVAYPHDLLAACEALAQDLGGVLASVLPLSVQAWDAAQPWRQAPGGAAVLGVLADGLAVLTDGARQPRHSHALRHAQPVAALRGQWRRRQLRQWATLPSPGAGPAAAQAQAGALPRSQPQAEPEVQPEVPARLTVLDLRSEARSQPLQKDADDAFTLWPLPAAVLADVSPSPSLLLTWLQSRPSPSAHALDAVQRRPSPARGWWLACAALWLMALALGLDNWSVWQDRRLAQASAPQPAQAPWLPEAAAPAFTREELGQVQQVNEAVRRLNVPIDPLLEALRAPQDIRVAVLSVDIRAGGTGGRGLGVVRAQAEEGVDMARYVAFVAARAPFVDAHLKQHERREDDAGRPYQFTMEAAWPQ
ncbi:hypothetical protein [Aquabacterium sp.]|uniref:hypothetical protein n=1 Tax=Aquabacterium sp. TaxID=1872578 RepID=UPI0025BA0166|nr:hypothetical protein [Aquabacterium sp.]